MPKPSTLALYSKLKQADRLRPGSIAGTMSAFVSEISLGKAQADAMQADLVAAQLEEGDQDAKNFISELHHKLTALEREAARTVKFARETARIYKEIEDFLPIAARRVGST